MFSVAHIFIVLGVGVAEIGYPYERIELFKRFDAEARQRKNDLRRNKRRSR